MKIAKTTVVLLVFVLMLSVFVANVANLISGNLDETESNFSDPKKYEIADSFDHLMWFLQVSDIHISIFQDPSRVTEMKEFCDMTISAIRPSVVVASGDLTDAKAEDRMGSRQMKGEWQLYKRVLDDTKVAERTVWLDVRGNHDNFNVPHIRSKQNYYLNYSMQGQEHPRSYMHQIKVGSEQYSFIAVDACLDPGPRRPFNFVGVLTGSETDKIHEFVRKAKEQGVDYIVWFGHYPTSCILSQCSGGVRSILGRYKESMAYLCGHFHMLGGAVPNMYTLQPGGFLELELADWKDNRMYRIAALDHGQFSFIDVKHREWPVAIVTNPKHALYVMPHKENLQSLVESTHIRVLAFSIAALKKVEIQLDDGVWLECRKVKGPLYVAKWDPSEYGRGLHNIQVRVSDDDGRQKTISQPFSLDGTRLSFRVLPRLILMFNISHIFQILFGSMILVLVVPLCVLRFLQKLCEDKRIHRPRIPIRIFHWWLRKLWVLSTIDRLFFPLVLYVLYLTFGPWAIGEVIDNHTGTIFAWGTLVGTSYLPGSFTYAYGFFQLFSFHFPLMMILAHRVDQRLQHIDKPPRKPPSMHHLIWRHIPVLLLITMQAIMAYFFWLAYGTLATVLGPLRTWSIFLAALLWYQVNMMPETCMRKAAMVWLSRSPVSGDNVDEDNRNTLNSHK